jgi:hypothetical protein
MPKNMGKMPMRLMGETPMLRRMAFFNGLLTHESGVLAAEATEKLRKAKSFEENRFSSNLSGEKSKVL